MSIRRLSNSTISTQGKGKSSNLIAGYSPAIDEMDLIERVVVGATPLASVTFGSGNTIPQTYQHLQLRALVRDSAGTTWYSCQLQFNGDTTAANYATHTLQGDGATATANGYTSTGGTYTPFNPGSNKTYFGAAVIDILDYANTSKNKVVRSVDGSEQNGSGYIRLVSGVWLSTAAITSIKIVAGNTAFVQYNTFALYGVKA